MADPVARVSLDLQGDRETPVDQARLDSQVTKVRQVATGSQDPLV